jgi:LacI family fructose operon transcriptional repressor
MRCDNSRLPESGRIGENVAASSKKQGNTGLKLSDIARLAGVSVTTASYVINGKAEQQRISNATVERVRTVV